jgi:hypothetical protein
MNYRLSTVFGKKNYSADMTEIIDLDMQDPISQLLIELDVLNVGNVAPTAHAIACLTKIEIVDGSDVLYSLNGYEAEAVDIYHNKRIRSNWNPYFDGNAVQRFIGINFGRWLWDTELAFNPKNFKNPQLKLSLDINAGGNVPVQNSLTVWANMFDEKSVNPMGFLMHKEIKNYIATASGHEYTDLPTDFPYRKFLLRCQKAGTEPCQILDSFKLSEEQDKKIIWNHALEEISRNLAQEHPMLTEILYGWVNNSSTYGYCTPTVRTVGNVNHWHTAAGSGEIAFYDGDGGRFKVIAATAAALFNAHVSGWAPHATYDFPFGNQADMDDWFDPSGIGSLKADILALAGIAGTETVQLFLQQLRPY